MKAVILTSVAGNGGSAATAYHHARVLQHAGWEVTLFAPGDYWVERGRAENVPVRNTLHLRRGLRPCSFSGDFCRLRRFLIDQQPDVLLVQKSPEQWLAALVLRTLRRPIALVRLRGVVFPIRPTWVNRWLHRHMDAVICSAGVIAHEYAVLPGFDAGRVKTLLEGIDTRYFAPASPKERNAARARCGLDPNALLIGTAGRPAPVKGHDVLVRAFAKAVRTGSARLCIFSDEARRGPGSYKSLDDLCGQVGVRERVTLLPGHVEDMRDVYRALDVYVLPSRGSEGSSRAALEASASGLPLVASRVGVLPELIVDGKTGRLVPPGDVDALAAALGVLVADWPAARKWGAAARVRMEAEFTEDSYARKLTALLEEAVARSRT
jgi:glycosyltransferase involved in cell wall biosynthesis